MSAASEALLAELIDINRAQADSLRSLAARSTGNAAGGGGGGGGVAGTAASVLGGVFKTVGSVISGTFSAALNLAGAGLSTLVSTGKTLAAQQMALSQGAIEGTNSLHSLTEGLSGLPFGLGLVANAMTYNTKKLESNLRVYDQISDVGARLGGNLTEVRTSAMNMGLGMDEFATVMKQNGPQLRFMGATADEGAKNLIKFNSTLIKGEVGKGLLGMGYSLTEANNLLGQYSASVGGLNANQMQDQTKMTKTVQLFAEELDASAQLEGKSRQQKAEEMKEAAANAAVNAKLASMTEDEKAKYQQAYNSALRIGGKGAAEALQSQMLGLPPMTKAAQQFTAANAEAAATVREQAAVIEDGSSAQEARTKLDKLDAKGRKESADFYEKNKTVMNAQIMAGGTLAETATAGAKSYGELKRQGLDTEEKIIAQKDKIRKEQDKAKDSAAGDAAQAQARAKFAGNLMDMLATALTPLFPVITFLTDSFAKFAPVIAKFATNVIDKVVVPVFKELFGGLKLNDFIKPFKDFWKGLFGGNGGLDLEGVKNGIVSFFKPIVSFVGDVMKMIDWEAVGGAFRKGFMLVSTFVKKISDAIDWKAVGTFIKDAFTAIYDFGKSLYDAFFSGSKLADLTNIFDGFLNLVKEECKGIKSAFDSVDFKGIGTGLGKAFKGVFDAVKEFLSPILETGSGVMRKIFSDLGPVFSDLSDITKLLLGHFNTLVKFIRENILPILQPVITGVIEALYPLWDGIKALIKAVKFILQGDFSKAGEMIKEAFTDMLAAIGRFFIGIKDGIVKLADMGWSGIVKFFTGKSAEPEPTAAAPGASGPKRGAPMAHVVPPTATEATNLPPPAPSPEKEKADRAKASEEKAKQEKSAYDNAPNPAATAVPIKSKDPVEILTNELQLLNKQFALLLQATRDTSDNTRRTKDLMAAGGNRLKG
jgi:hypothetical protein